MKWTVKNIFILLIVIMMVMITVIPIFAETKPPFTDDDYYNNLCNGQSYADNKKTCDEYKAYYKKKIEDSNATLKANKFELSEVKANAEKYNKLYNELSVEVVKLENQVKNIKSGIANTERYIAKLEKDIAAQELEVETKEAQVLDYIATSQTQTYANPFIDFIMGAKDFSEVVSRMEGMKRIKEYNDEVIEQLNIQKEKIVQDKVIAQDSVELMKIDEDIAQKKTFELETRVEEAGNLYKTFTTLTADIEAASAKLQKEIKYSEAQLDKIGSVVVSTGGWTHALGSNKSLYRNNSWGFVYRAAGLTGFHNGADYATYGSRIPVYAPGNGFVALAEENGCGDGGLGNGCGGAWGNYISLIVDINGEIFGVSLAHLTSGSISIKQGDTVKAGQQIGRVGTSGSSTGMHLHAEVYRLPHKSVTEAANAFMISRDRNFGAGSGAGSSRLCHKGASAPCKVDAPLLWGDRTLSSGYYY